MASEFTVVVPFKGTTAGKSRITGSSLERTELALAMALDTVEAALGAARVIVVTSAGAGRAFRELGATVVLDTASSLNAAVSLAAAGVAGPVAALLGDLPSLQPAELMDALARAAQHPRAMVPDADDSGTVLITALERRLLEPAFGVGSRAAHRALGYVELAFPADSGLRRDIDTREQLADLRDADLGARTRLLW